jgi:hypothetical protein
VLERPGIGVSGDSVQVDTIVIGVHAVIVRARVSDSLPGLAWVRVLANSGSGGASWRLETVRRTGN